MYKLIFLSLLFCIHIFANDLTLVKSIEKDAIIYGSGYKNVYVFIDPLCRFSRKFITMVTNNPLMLEKYRYHLYLYEIPRLHSHKSIVAVYKDKKPLKTLLKIMIKDNNITAQPTPTISAKISNINTIAHQIDVNKRPYLIIEK